MKDKQCSTKYVAPLQCSINNQYLIPGNITPHIWFKKFCDKSGNPDLIAIMALTDVFAWVRNGTNEYYGGHMPNYDGISLSLSYEYFYEKFGFNKERVRRAFVRLEKFGVLKRYIRNIELSSGCRVNRLFITIDKNFFNSCFRDPNQDIRVGEGCFAETHTDSIFNNKISLPLPSPHKCGDLLSNKNINKDRSIKSNFLRNSFFKKEDGGLLAQPNHSQSKSPFLQLKDFYPLSSDDAKSLQIRSGREFSLNAMNEILLDMSKRVKDRWFKSKRGFLSYMSLVFKHEMRDASKISDEGFKIKDNQTLEEITVRKQEEFLSQIEYSLQVSPECHLKKKLCSALEREKAYNLLSSYKSCRKEGNNFKIYLAKHCQLTERDRDIILNQVKATHESVSLSSGRLTWIEKLEIIMPLFDPKTELAETKGMRKEREINAPALETLGIWGKIRQSLILYHGEKGEALDKSWFSQLEPEVDETAKRITLRAPTEFIKDWINRNYAQILERYLEKQQYSYVIC